MKFISVYKIIEKAVPLLYKIMEEREPFINISHKALPTIKNHIEFILSMPYKNWYIIKNNKDYIGSVYISKQNEVGLFILKKYQGMGYGKKVIRWIIKNNKEVYFNINPKNIKAKKLFKKLNFKHIQSTYKP